MNGLLAFVPHPDDEAYAFAGTLARAADAGWRTHVLCATRGEGGGDPATRTRELEASCAALGCAPPVFLDLPDGQLAALEPPLDRLRVALDAAGADVVLTLGPDGAYGHPDHLACTRWMEAAVGHRTLLHAVFPRGLFDEVRRRVRRFRRDLVAYDAPLGRALADLTVDITMVADRKLAALAAHASQLPGGDPRRFLVPGLVDSLLEVERFDHVAGPALSELP